MLDFLKKISSLAVELDSKKGFEAIAIIDEMKRLYENHIDRICSDLRSELDAIEWIKEMKKSVGQKKKISE